MKHSSYVLGATLVAATIAGCGGSNVSKGTQVTQITPNSGPTTKLASIGYIDTIYLSGAGRGASRPLTRDYGDVAVYISSADWTDEQGNTASAPAGAAVTVQADAYSGPQVIETPITFGPSTNPQVPSTATDSRLFGNYVFNFNYLTTNVLPGTQIPPSNVWVITNGNMGLDEQATDGFPTALVPGETAVNPFTPQSYPAYVRAFPGRFSAVTVRLDPNTIGLNFQEYSDPNNTIWGPSNPRGIFEATQFNTINFAGQTTPSFNSVLSDFVSFDLSHMSTPSGGAAGSQWPTLTASGGSVVGKRVYFSGDNYAISDSTSSGNFYELTTDISPQGNPAFPGTFSTNQNVSGITLPSGALGYLPGTYALTQINPGNPSFTSLIISQEGMFVDYSQMVTGVTPVMAITFPSSQDNNIQDMVLFKTNTLGQIVDFYYGYIDYEALQVFLFPINTLVSAQPTTTNQGTISASNLYTASGAVATGGQTTVRSGSFKLNTPITWQDGSGSTFSTGRFIVYRK